MVIAVCALLGFASACLAAPEEKANVVIVWAVAAVVLHVGLGAYGRRLERQLDDAEAEVAALRERRLALEKEYKRLKGD